MVSYFNLSCCSPQAAIRTVVFINLIIIFLGGVHFGYCAVIGKFIEKFDDPFLISQRQFVQKLLQPPMTYIAVAGSLQVLISFTVILFALQCLGKQNRNIWRRIIFFILIVSFAFNFAVATSTSMNSVFYNYYLNEDWLDMIEKANPYNTLVRDFIKVTRVMKRYTIAEAVLTFALILPLISVTIMSLMDNQLNEDVNIPTTPTIDSAVHIQKGPYQPN